MSERTILPLLAAAQQYDAVNEQQARATIEDRLRSLEFVVANGEFAVEKEVSLSLANGANNDVSLGVGTFFTVSGPTGAFSISGFASPVNGRMVTVYNPTANNMTITNDATSTAANRILTLTGADVVLTGTSVACFRYSAVSSRWILCGTQG